MLPVLIGFGKGKANGEATMALSIVLLVIFTASMLLWVLGLVGVVPAQYSGWLPFIAVLVLGIVVFLRDPGWPSRGPP